MCFILLYYPISNTLDNTVSLRGPVILAKLFLVSGNKLKGIKNALEVIPSFFLKLTITVVSSGNFLKKAK